jgi:hypothetical protein
MKEFYQKATIMLSVLAIIISLMSFGYTIYTTEQSKREDLSVSTSICHADYKTEIIQQNISSYPAILPTWYECILVNNGDRPVNIVDYELQQVSGSIISYSGMNMGLFDKSGKQIEYPLTLKPHDSCAFHLKVGLLISPKAFEILKRNFTFENKTSMYNINSLLAKNGTDLYGNSAEYIGEDNANGISISANRSEQIFSLTFITSDHKSFTDIFSKYS